MTDKTREELIAEVYTRSQTMVGLTDILNAFSAFLAAPVKSPSEDQAEAHLNSLVVEYTSGDRADLSGHVILALCALICEAADPARIQGFLDHQQEAIQKQADDCAL